MLRPWAVLLLESDQESARLLDSALTSLQVLGRRVELVAVRSLEEAKVLLEVRGGFALFIADIGLLNASGGLDFIRWLRARKALQSLRVVLRTEEVGSAPKNQLLRELEISDCWPRRELTLHRIQLQGATLLRAYHDQRAYQQQRQALKQMINCVGLLSAERGLSQLLAQLLELIDPQLSGRGAVLLFFQLTTSRRLREGILLGGTGPYQQQQPRPLSELLPRERLRALEESFRSKRMVRSAGTMSFLRISRGGQGCALIVRELGALSAWVEESLMTLCEGTLQLISEQLMNHQRQRQISAAERFIPRSLISLFGRRSALALELGDFQRCEGWVLCCELKGLSALEDAPEIERQLLEASQLILPCLKRYGGLFDRAVGQRLIAHFPGREAPLACCRELGALLNLEAMDTLNVHLGLHGGELLLCTLGSEERLEITVISEAVQLAMRLSEVAAELSCFAIVSDLALAAAPPTAQEWLRPVGRYQGREVTGRTPLFQLLTPSEGHHTAPSALLEAIIEGVYQGDPESGVRLQELTSRYPRDALLPVLMDHFVTPPSWS